MAITFHWTSNTHCPRPHPRVCQVEEPLPREVGQVRISMSRLSAADRICASTVAKGKPCMRQTSR